MAIYFGDLNFRIDLPRAAIEKAIKEKNFDSLMVKDELYQHGMRHEVLKSCQEGKLLFDPSYKYDQGTSNYDTTKRRAPAWTDRVLFSQTNQSMTLTKYNRSEISISDHKPIYAHFKVKVNKINPEAKALVEENLIAKFSAMKVNQRN